MERRIQRDGGKRVRETIEKRDETKRDRDTQRDVFVFAEVPEV